MCASNILIFGLQHCFWREDSGSTRRGLITRSGDRIACLFIVFVYWNHYRSSLSWELFTAVSCKEGSGLRSDMGVLSFCCPFTKKCDRSTYARSWDTDTGVRPGAGCEMTGGGGTSPGGPVLRKYLTDCSSCQHCLIHMSNNISRKCPVCVPFQKD